MTSAVAIGEETIELPKKALEEMAFLVGDWEESGTFNGEEFKGTYSARWAPGKHCLILKGYSEGSVAAHASGIGGWSPDRKQYVEHWYVSSGEVRTFRNALGDKEGTWTGKWIVCTKEGKTGSGKMALQKMDNEFRFKATGTLDGEEVEVEAITKKK